MITWTAVSRKIQYVLQEAFAVEGTESEVIAKFLITNLPRRPASTKEKPSLKQFLEERQIEEVIHFTRIENVPHILNYGLIPRIHLEETAINIVLNPYFTDSQRYDKQPLANCLSFSHPNYRMFYKKRMLSSRKADWAVLSLDPSIVVDIYCEFSPGNAATYGVDTRSGSEKARRLFSGLNLRIDLALAPYETTNPEAEILEDTVIPPSKINHVYVSNEKAVNLLGKKGIKASIGEKYFKQRRDYEKWQNGISFDGSDDYLEVLNFEKSNLLN